MIGKDHKAEGKLPICNSLELNYFTKNKLVFNSKHRLLAYIGKAMLVGRTEFYFRLEGKMNQAEVVKEVDDLVMRYLAGEGKRKIRIQYNVNETINTCWIKIS